MPKKKIEPEAIVEELTQAQPEPEIAGEPPDGTPVDEVTPAIEPADEKILVEQDLSSLIAETPAVDAPAAETPDIPFGEAGEARTTEEVEELLVPNDPAPEDMPQKTDRQQFFELKFNEIDRNLSPVERQEWNNIYASYRGRSVMTGTIIGVDELTVGHGNRREKMYCAIVVPLRVRIVIPATEMWMEGSERPDFVLRNLVGAKIDFVIIKVDREGGFAIASRRMALRSRRYYFSHKPSLNEVGNNVNCQVLAVGPRRCLVSCYGHDIELDQRDMRYTAIPDLRDEFHPGQSLRCMITAYDMDSAALIISVKATTSNPFDNADVRHPLGSRRQAVISGKYGGGVFCNLSDDVVVMCGYSFHYEDSDFMVGDTVIITISDFNYNKKQMYGKIIAKW